MSNNITTSERRTIIEDFASEINKYKDDIVDASDHGVLIGRKELADAILKILGLLEE